MGYSNTAAFYLAKHEVEVDVLVQETYLWAFRYFDEFKPGGLVANHLAKSLHQPVLGIVLVDIGELTSEEAVKVMGCPIGTVAPAFLVDVGCCR